MAVPPADGSRDRVEHGRAIGGRPGHRVDRPRERRDDDRRLVQRRRAAAPRRRLASRSRSPCSGCCRPAARTAPGSRSAAMSRAPAARRLRAAEIRCRSGPLTNRPFCRARRRVDQHAGDLGRPRSTSSGLRTHRVAEHRARAASAPRPSARAPRTGSRRPTRVIGRAVGVARQQQLVDEELHVQRLSARSPPSTWRHDADRAGQPGAAERRRDADREIRGRAARRRRPKRERRRHRQRATCRRAP